MIHITHYKDNTAILSGDEFDIIREHFSIINEAKRFVKKFYIPSRKYFITNSGKFDLGLVDEIIQICSKKDINYTLDKKIESFLHPKFNNIKSNDYSLHYTLRDYQQTIVNKCIQKGRGTIVLATAGGKTLTMCSFIEWYYKNISPVFRATIIVPDLGLVNQTFNDFKEYKCSFTFSKYTGKDELNLHTNVVITNLGILQSKARDNKWIESVDLLIQDECHKSRYANQLNKILKKIKTPYKFGFTGTLPSEKGDLWNITGKIGPVIYEKNSHELRKENYVCDVKVHILNIQYNQSPPQIQNLREYDCEKMFIIDSQYRRDVVSKICKTTKNNTLVLVDYIQQGTIMYEEIKKHCSHNKHVYFIRGNVDVNERKRIQQLMEQQNDIVVIAITKIFSTGINIKNLHYIVFANFGKSKITTVQSIGRGLRLHQDKKRVVIFDIADTLKYGSRHIRERMKIYDLEKIPYEQHYYEEKT